MYTISRNPCSRLRSYIKIIVTLISLTLVGAILILYADEKSSSYGQEAESLDEPSELLDGKATTTTQTTLAYHISQWRIDGLRREKLRKRPSENSCEAEANVGDTCEKFTAGYGIYSVGRLMEMNPDLECDGPGLLCVAMFAILPQYRSRVRTLIFAFLFLFVTGTFFILYPREPPPDQATIFARELARSSELLRVRRENMKAASKRGSCRSTAHEGDNCAGFTSGFGIYSVEKFMEMNEGLKCEGDGMLEVGKEYAIRADLRCGAPCTKELC
ncbi:hypothetical protein BV898_08615 [Hypsibius exemplaris]|uniref:LysM domain-containing protein n=1 Tax=Hypsibius exemplaris TaxID=2072580 RepID=A0A1W0WPZ6_HYPEX|nr:hypothetical protein BV898_08615 [Hypsibius exemplaris]